ncbi:MAG TPA: hypothetical protein VF721_12125 [Pyrinomonadaceae bacterium]|jgi:hypothetical protein
MKIVAIWLLASCFLACAVNDKQSAPLIAAATPVNVKNAKVTLQIYSGRENPSWSLSEKQIDEMLALLKDLPKAKPGDLQDGLGYQGFQVQLTENATKKTHEIVVNKGRILYKTAEADAYYADRDRRLEKFLLKSGDSHLDDKLSKSIEDEIESQGN